MALEYESNPNLVGAIKAPLGVLGSDKNYRQALYETVAEQVEGLGRRPNSDYTAGDVVTSSTNNQLQLLCTTSGTTSINELDISANTEGDTITDGTVSWKVVKRNYLGSDGVLPVANGGTGANNASDACKNLGAVRSVDGISADDNGNVNTIVAKGNKYVRFESGLQICWGSAAVQGSTDVTITLPIAFKDANWTLSVLRSSSSDTKNIISIWQRGSLTKTSFNVYSDLSNQYTAGVLYLAIGFWK